MSKNLIALQNKFLGLGETVYDMLARLHDKQGFISDADIERLAAEHNIPPQHIRATAKFYEELSHDKPATHTIKLCNGEACRAAGYAKCERSFMASLGVSRMGDVNTKGVRLEHVTCLGYCGLGPNVMVDGVPVSLAAGDAVHKIVEHVRSNKPLGLTEPVNAIHMPPTGKPCIVMRNFAKDVVSLAGARAAGVYTAFEKALKKMTPQAVIDEVKASGLRGRGGAGFPAGIKLETVSKASSEDDNPHGLAVASPKRAEHTTAPDSPVKQGRKFVVVNADEGDAGSYIDKEIMERDPHSLIEGALIAAYACGAHEIYFYIRFEYPRSLAVMRKAIDEARAGGLLGANILGSSFSCEAKIVKGQGAYICGEETSLLRSIEGVPAIVSFKPPFPAEKGLWGCPTAVNNVETLHNLPFIVQWPGAYAILGHEKSRGTKAVTLNTRVKKPGMYEVELGTTLRELIFDIAGGMADGQKFKAVQVGGPLGGIFPEKLLDTPLDFEAFGKAKGLLGHAGVVVYSEEDDLVEIARWLMEFCAIESCGKCFPCRIGAVRGTELIEQMMESGVTDARLSLLGELCETMKYGSLCALGGAIPTPIETLMEYFPGEFTRYRKAASSAAKV